MWQQQRIIDNRLFNVRRITSRLSSVFSGNPQQRKRFTDKHQGFANLQTNDIHIVCVCSTTSNIKDIQLDNYDVLLAFFWLNKNYLYGYSKSDLVDYITG